MPPTLGTKARSASTTPVSTPSKAGAGGMTTPLTTPSKAHHRGWRLFAAPTPPPPHYHGPAARAASPAAAATAASLAPGTLPANREWELDRIRRLLYEQEVVSMREALAGKDQEIETVRREKTRITKVRFYLGLCGCVVVSLT